MNTIEALAEGTTVKNKNGSCILKESGAAIKTGKHDCSASFPHVLSTGRVGRRTTKNVMLDDNYGYRHKDTKNKALTVKNKQVFSPGFGSDGNLVRVAYRTGLNENQLNDRNVKCRTTIKKGQSQNVGFYPSHYISDIPAENPVHAVTQDAFTHSSTRDVDVDVMKTGASKMEPGNIVTPCLNSAPTITNSPGLEYMFHATINPNYHMASARKQKIMNDIAKR